MFYIRLVVGMLLSVNHLGYRIDFLITVVLLSYEYLLIFDHLLLLASLFQSELACYQWKFTFKCFCRASGGVGGNETMIKSSIIFCILSKQHWLIVN